MTYSEVEVLGVEEFSDTAAGIEALDAVLKAAPISIVEVLTINPARFVILCTGDVASVQASLKSGRTVGIDSILDELIIENLHPAVLPALRATAIDDEWDALGIIEAYTITAGIEAADCAAKRAAVNVVEIRADNEMGGRSAMKMMGPLSEIEVAMDAARNAVEARARLVRSVVIPRPDPEMRRFYRVPAGGRSK